MKLAFPTALILLNLGAALFYCDDWRKLVFYGAAAAINLVQVV
jgi:hypothetical protein